MGLFPEWLKTKKGKAKDLRWTLMLTSITLIRLQCIYDLKKSIIIFNNNKNINQGQLEMVIEMLTSTVMDAFTVVTYCDQGYVLKMNVKAQKIGDVGLIEISDILHEYSKNLYPYCVDIVKYYNDVVNKYQRTKNLEQFSKDYDELVSKLNKSKKLTEEFQKDLAKKGMHVDAN